MPTDVTSPANELQLAVLRDNFDYTNEFLHGSLAPGYYWFRKRAKVLGLIEKHIDQLIGTSSSWKFAELGCDKGIELFLIRKRVLSLISGSRSLTFVGVDGNASAIHMCELREKYFNSTDTRFMACNFTGVLPIPDGELNFIYCSEVLEHLLEPEFLLREVNRTLAPGGYFLMTTPNEPNLFQRSFWDRSRRAKNREEAMAHPLQAVDQDGKPWLLYGHVSVRTALEWDRAITALGFTLVDAARGAMMYKTPASLNAELGMGLQMMAEAALDLLPLSWTRSISDQVIALYRKIQD